MYVFVGFSFRRQGLCRLVNLLILPPPSHWQESEKSVTSTTRDAMRKRTNYLDAWAFEEINPGPLLGVVS